MFNNMREAVSPRSGQDFIWLAEYLDGTNLSEFNLDGNNEENSFYDIDKNKLLRFGFLGNGVYLFYEIDGVFKLAGQTIEVIYKDKATNIEYYLTGRQEMYNDIICYKDAESTVNISSSGQNMTNIGTTISQYNFGYKFSFNINEVNFNFQAVCKIPFGQPVFIEFWLVADTTIDGVFIIKKRGEIVAEIDAPLEQGVGGLLNWMVTN